MISQCPSRLYSVLFCTTIASCHIIGDVNSRYWSMSEAHESVRGFNGSREDYIDWGGQYDLERIFGTQMFVCLFVLFICFERHLLWFSQQLYSHLNQVNWSWTNSIKGIIDVMYFQRKTCSWWRVVSSTVRHHSSCDGTYLMLFQQAIFHGFEFQNSPTLSWTVRSYLQGRLSFK